MARTLSQTFARPYVSSTLFAHMTNQALFRKSTTDQNRSR